MGKLSDQQRLEICERYKAGQSSGRLGLEYDVSDVTILRVLEAHGIQRRDGSISHRTHTVNSQYFQAIDTEQKAYWLGFLAADGSISNNQKRYIVRVGLSSKDAGHLESLRDALGSTAPIRISPNNGAGYANLNICCRDLFLSLHDLGFESGKGRRLQFPVLDPELERHFIRGYIDGDGCYSSRPNSRKPDWKSQIQFHLIGNRSFLLEVQARLVKHCDFGSTKLGTTKSDGLFLLRCQGNRKIARLAHYLYEGATIWLPRKRLIAETSCHW